MKNESTFSGAVNSTHVKFATAMHECNPLITLPYRLLHTDEALRDARWLIESSDVPSRALLIQVIVQYLNISEPVRDDLSTFTANVGKTIDFVLLVTDMTIQDLTRISQQTGLPESPGVPVPTSTTKDLTPYGHARVLLGDATAIAFPDFFFQPLKEFYRSFSKASASTAMNLVVSAFTVYIDEISPKIIVLISQVDELLANLKRLQADLDNIRQVTGNDKRSLSESCAVIEDQRRYWKRFWVMIGGDADDMGPIERRADTLSRIDKVVIDGVQSLNGVLWALKGVEADLQGLKEDIRIYKNHYRLAKGSEMSRSCHIQTVKLSAEKLRLAKEDWARLRREVTNQIFGRGPLGI